jgi:hypothetical protein
VYTYLQGEQALKQKQKQVWECESKRVSFLGAVGERNGSPKMRGKGSKSPAVQDVPVGLLGPNSRARMRGAGRRYIADFKRVSA